MRDKDDPPVVVIGRNEGGRLRSCLESVRPWKARTVYVDSGSVDGSVALARGLGFVAIPLDESAPYTAARSRNAGLAWVRKRWPECPSVQFVDGDCELDPHWLAHGAAELAARPEAAVVFGHVRERARDESIYNRLCDIEWQTPLGEVDGCGGVALMRVDALAEVGDFDPTVIAAEDTELGSRLRARGWRIVHVDAEMVRHDAGLLRFGQWWRRCLRAGHAYAEFRGRRPRGTRTFFARRYRSVWIWAVLVPAAALGLAPFVGSWALALLLLYPAQAALIYQRKRVRCGSADAALYAVSCLLAKWAQLAGVLRYHLTRLLGRRSRIIEHKAPVVVLR